MSMLPVSITGGAGLRIKTGESVKATVEAWVVLPTGLLVARYGAGAFIYNKRLYVVGGVTERGPTGVVEVIDLSTMARYTVAPMPDARAHFAYAFVNGRFYVAGGIDRGGVPRREVFAYDPATDTWKTVASLPKGVAYASGVGMVKDEVSTSIYVIGGMDEAGTVVGDVYEIDPDAGTVTPKSPMNVPRENHACAELGGKIYCFGGDDGNQNLDTIESYDPATDTWTLLDVKLPVPATGLRATTIIRGDTPLILVVGG